MKSLKFLLTAVAVLAASQAASAAKIVGSIAFDGSVALDGSVATATQVTDWDAEVELVSADFLSTVAVGDAVAFVAPWSFNSGPVASFWEVGGFVFDLTSSTIEFQSNAFLSVTGKGFVSGNGYDASPGVWNFSTQNPNVGGRFSFSASTEVPDSGATLALLGLGLIGLVSVRRIRN